MCSITYLMLRYTCTISWHLLNFTALLTNRLSMTSNDYVSNWANSFTVRLLILQVRIPFHYIFRCFLSYSVNWAYSHSMLFRYTHHLVPRIFTDPLHPALQVCLAYKLRSLKLTNARPKIVRRSGGI